MTYQAAVRELRALGFGTSSFHYDDVPGLPHSMRMSHWMDRAGCHEVILMVRDAFGRRHGNTDAALEHNAREVERARAIVLLLT